MAGLGGWLGRVRAKLETFLEENGYELWNVEWNSAGGSPSLTVTIEKDGGIGTDDCEFVSRRLDWLDNYIQPGYDLIVSSPGMDRPLLTDAHFARYIGTPVDVKLYKGVDGSRKYGGELVGRDEETLTIRLEDGTEKSFPRTVVSGVRLQVIF
ncbi:MAG: ribosome maturation factor RimP [Clostridiales Family XIII bacterium]|jgi:ribosome maturation factor RimP|nr:ribosome maturation factor RimP [Clostridiales Family XIII bacterium]